MHSAGSAPGEDRMSESYPLHECVFKGDTRKLSQLLRSHEPTEKDKHGEFLGRRELLNTTNRFGVFGKVVIAAQVG